jgi:hypothetical protein
MVNESDDIQRIKQSANGTHCIGKKDLQKDLDFLKIAIDI